MAAMAPALTDAPNEASHRIRFKLAPPSSTLSPSAMETTPGSAHLSPRGAGPGRRGEEPGRGVAKLQPLVASYLCSDVTPVPSSKLQALLLPPPAPASRRAPPPPPLNGMAKKQGGHNPALNGDTTPPLTNATDSTEHAPSNGGSTHAAGGAQQQAPPPPATSPSERPDSEPSGRPPSLPKDGSSPATPAEGPVVGQQGDAANSLGPGTSAEEEPVLLQEPEGMVPEAGPETEAGPEAGQEALWLQERAQQSQGRQDEMAGRLRQLRRRLQVVQAKQVERHLQQQLDGFLEHVQEGRGQEHTPGGRSQEHALGGRGQEDWDGIGRLLKQGSTGAELERLCLSGRTALRGVEAGFDSDATASSSGGETDVEEEELSRPEPEQRHISLWRRAEGRFAVERASIISHWSWLQAHVSDLEYRIRQHTDIYRQLRVSKGSVLLGDPVPSEDGEVKAEPAADSITQDTGAGSSGSVSMETGLRKGCVSGRQVNGVINSLHSSSAELEEHQRRPLQRPLLDQANTAARTRPLISCKRRRLLRPSTLNNLHRKAQRQAVCRCPCEVNPQCVTCGGRSSSSSSSPAPELQYDRPLLERLAQFDPSLHPILSLSDDVMMSLHLQAMLKSEWNSRPLNKMKPLKKLSLKHRLSSSFSSSTSSSFSKNRHKLSNSSPLLSSGRSSHSRVRSDKLRRQQLDSPFGPSLPRSRTHNADKPRPRKRPRNLSLDRMDSPQGPSKLYMDSGSSYSALHGLHTPTHPLTHPLTHSLTHPLTHTLTHPLTQPHPYSPLVRQLSTPTEACGPFTLSGALQQQPPRRRRGESSFDINNIVIPMSLAATTRVEKIQYKEIITPSWREVEVNSRPLAAEEEEGVEVEDLSDQMFTQLHQPCEDQERTRYRWAATTAAAAAAASTVAKRRGSRSYKSVDGRTTPLLCSTTPSTPQPSSPDSSHFHMLHDYGSSPCSPASPELPSPYPPSPYPHGTRDTHRLLSSDDTRCSTPDNSEDLVSLPVLPWEPRTFPLDSEPEREPDEEAAEAAERPYRTLRRTSTCRTAGSSRSESDTGEPPSPLSPPDDISRHKHSTGHTHSHRHAHR